LEDWKGTEEEEKEEFKTVNKDGISLRYLRYGIFPYSGTLTLVDEKGNLVKEEDFLEGQVYKK
jgi:hypothetical protein